MPDKETRAATLAELQKSREIYAMAPSGATFKIRPMNLTRYALAGHMPAQLRKLALDGAAGIDAALAEPEGDMIAEHGGEMLEYLDGLVRQVVVAPELAGDDLEALLPIDYKWLVQIALGEEDSDGEGRRLWGKAPLSVWGTFRDEHQCPTDCAACDRMRRSVADSQPGRDD